MQPLLVLWERNGFIDGSQAKTHLTQAVMLEMQRGRERRAAQEQHQLPLVSMPVGTGPTVPGAAPTSGPAGQTSPVVLDSAGSASASVGILPTQLAASLEGKVRDMLKKVRCLWPCVHRVCSGGYLRMNLIFEARHPDSSFAPVFQVDV